MESKYSWRWLWLLGLAGAAALALIFAFQPTRSVRGKSPAQPLSAELSADQSLAQDLALLDARVQSYTVGRQSEVFGVHDVAWGHYPETSSACDTALCKRVEIYNFDENSAVTAFVNLDTRQVLDVLQLPGMHPGINKRLSDLANEIAFNDEQVIETLGFRPESADMAPVESNLVESDTCNMAHLCAAVTFELGEEVLWAIVDITAEEVIHLGYTNIVIDDRIIEEVEPQTIEDCNSPDTVSRDGWDLTYITSGSDGLVVYDATFNGMTMFTQAKLAEWHADYGSFGYVDATGCSPNGGFPIFPFGDTQVVDLLENGTQVGFEVIQDFRMNNWGNSCNYRYEQRFHFYNDGRFRVFAGAYGKGCGTNALYRPVMRIDVAVDGDAGDSFAVWNGSGWSEWATEDWNEQDANSVYSPEGYLYRVSDSSGVGLYLEPGQGQFGDGGRGDDAYIYATQHNPAEGDGDLGAIGSCCNDNYQQGPHNYLNGQDITDQNIVLWYVTQAETDTTPGDYYCWTISGEPNPETYPCFAGPMFHPYGLEDEGDVIYVSGSGSGGPSINQVPYQANDILAYDTRTASWSLFFDGATAGLPANSNINAFATYGPAILMSFDNVTNVPGIGIVDSADVVYYLTTNGQFVRLLDGSDVYLTNGGGGIDALAVSPDGRLLVSTGAPVQYNGVNTSEDEDVLAFTKISWGANTQGSWTIYMDGSDIGLGGDENADVRGVWVDSADNTIYLALRDTFNMGGTLVERGDIVACATPLLGGGDSSCSSVQVFWDGSAVGVGNFFLDGIEIDPTPSQAQPLGTLLDK